MHLYRTQMQAVHRSMKKKVDAFIGEMENESLIFIIYLLIYYIQTYFWFVW